MRRPRLFWRIFATYLVIVVLCTAAVGFYAVRSVRGFYVDHTERELQARAALVRRADPPGHPRRHAGGARGAGAAARRSVRNAHHAHRRGPSGGHQGRSAGRLGLRPAGDGEPRHPPRSPCGSRGAPGPRDTVQQDAVAGHDVRRPAHHGGRPAHDGRAHGRPAHARQRRAHLPVREHRRQRDRGRGDRGDHRPLRVATHQRTDACDQGGRRAPCGRGLHPQAVRATRRGVRVGRREHQPDGRRARRQAAPAHARTQRARGGAREHGRGRARGGHRRAGDRRERAPPRASWTPIRRRPRARRSRRSSATPTCSTSWRRRWTVTVRWRPTS